MSREWRSRSVVLFVALGLFVPLHLGAQEQQSPQSDAPATVAAPEVSPQRENQAEEPAAASKADGNQSVADPANAADPNDRALTADRPASVAFAERMEQALAKPVVVDFTEAPLSEVMAHLQQYCQIPIYLDLKSLEDVGIGSDVPVTITVKDVTLRSALELILGELELTYAIRYESLNITTSEQAESVLLTRVYPVADFAVAAPPSLIVPEPYSRYRVLLRLLAECVAPQTWEEVGGAGSALVYEPWGVLVVTQTQQVHEELELLLTALRKTRTVSATAGTAPEDATQAAIPVAVQEGQKHIKQALDSNVTFEFSDAPLAEVVAFLAEDRGIPILIDKKALDDVGLSGETTVTLAVREMTLRSALRLVLRELDLAFTVRHEVLLVTTPEEVDDALEIRVYSVADFLSGTSPATNPLEADTQIRSWQDVVERTISPDSWDHVGGAGSLAPVAAWGVMVISQSEDVHAQIAALLRQTRQARRSENAATVPAGELLSTASVPEPSAILAPGDVPVVAQTLVIPGPSSVPSTVLTPPSLSPPSLSPPMVLKLYAAPDFESDQLAKAIRGTVAPGSWTNDPAGVDSGPVIFTVGTNLLIRQTESGHAQIEQLIQGLRPHKR